MWAFAKEIQSGVSAELISPFLKSDGKTCIKFYYQLPKGILLVKIREQLFVRETVIWSKLNRRESNHNNWDWEKVVRILPGSPYFRIVFVAYPTDGYLSVAIDDVTVGPCKYGRADIGI
jgi:hypothetical protein